MEDNFLQEEDEEREPEAAPEGTAPDAEPKGLDALFNEPPVHVGNLSEGDDADWIKHTGNPERTIQNLIENHETLLAYYREAGTDKQVAEQERLLAILKGEHPGPQMAGDTGDQADEMAEVEAAGEPDMKHPSGEDVREPQQPKLAEGWGEEREDDWGTGEVELGGPDEDDWGR